tara:strand:+ start:30 stop:1958 length:1929 start_codon:yes stop_codon:yes gene_type:complete
MAQATAEVFEFPAGGIADFYMEDHEIEALEREEAKQEFGSSGIATFEPIAKRMASYGRFGDDTVAHVETGELVVPKALIDDNPRLRDSIFSHLRELGIEDPERYVVGSGVNSINPETGMPEFFNPFKAIKKVFRGVKKAASKIAKGVKKTVKKVAKVIKKVAPVVLPIALSFTPLGAIYGAALGSGIGTLIQGGSLKDALKSAAIAGASGAVFKGLGNKFSGKGTFMEGVAKEAANPVARLSETATNFAKGDLFGSFSGVPKDPSLAAEQAAADTAVGTADKAALTAEQAAADATNLQGQYAQGAGTTATDAGTALQTVPPGSDDFIRDPKIYEALTGKLPTSQNLSVGDFGPGSGPTFGADAALAESSRSLGQADSLLGADAALAESSQLLGAPPSPPPTMLERLQSAGETAGDYLFRGGESKAAIDAAASTARQDAIKKSIADSVAGGLSAKDPAVVAKALKAGEAAAAAAGPGLLATFGPTAALAGAGLYAAGAFTPQEPEDAATLEELQAAMGPTGEQLLAQDPDRYGNLQGGIKFVAGPAPTTDYTQGIPNNVFLNPFIRPVQPAAKGGEIFPRRVGGIMPDEGTPGKDSVRAMLMPGEFVMTTKAVKGLGDGDNNKGINRMYDMMRSLEAKGKAMA